MLLSYTAILGSFTKLTKSPFYASETVCFLAIISIHRPHCPGKAPGHTFHPIERKGLLLYSSNHFNCKKMIEIQIYGSQAAASLFAEAIFYPCKPRSRHLFLLTSDTLLPLNRRVQIKRSRHLGHRVVGGLMPLLPLFGAGGHLLKVGGGQQWGTTHISGRWTSRG